MRCAQFIMIQRFARRPKTTSPQEYALHQGVVRFDGVSGSSSLYCNFISPWISVHSCPFVVFSLFLVDLPSAVGLGGRGYSVKEDSAPYAFAGFNSDSDSDSDPDPDPDEASTRCLERLPRFSENVGC